MKKLIYISLVLFLASSGMKAQEERPQVKFPKYTLAIQPYSFYGGPHLDFETQLSNDSRKWLQISAVGIVNTDYDGSNDGWETINSDGYPILSAYGAGIGASYKYIFSMPYFYASAGLAYTHYNVRYAEYKYLEFVEDGLTFYEGVYFKEKQKFNKLSSDIRIGFQSPLNHIVFFDAFVGVGYSYSFYDKDKKKFDRKVHGYGYRGIYPTVGLRLGIAF